jgi:dihydrofolate reductase
MRKMVWLVNTTLDGFTAGLEGDLNWTIVDDEVWDHTTTIFDAADTTLFGRVTFEGFQAYWPTVPGSPNATPRTTRFARWIDGVEKVVVSKTLGEVGWNNTKVIGANLEEEVRQLKAQPGRDIVVMGSPVLARALIDLGLIDEFRVNVNPVLIGAGLALAPRLEARTDLQLLSTKPFQAGVVELRYGKR